MRPAIRAIDGALMKAGIWITRGVGTMWCALLFTLIALVSLPGAITAHNLVVLVGWVAQTFLQLVLLAVIMVGQAAESAKTEHRDQETHDTVMAEHAETREILRDVHALLTSLHVADPQEQA